jgi:hypothetical protein
MSDEELLRAHQAVHAPAHVDPMCRRNRHAWTHAAFAPTDLTTDRGEPAHFAVCTRCGLIAPYKGAQS